MDYRIRTSPAWQVIVALAVLLAPCPLFAHDAVWPGEKLKALYPEAISFEQKNLYVSDEQRARIEKQLGGKLRAEDLKPSIYLAVVRDRPEVPPRKAAAIIFIDAPGEAGKIEMGVAVSGKGDIIRVRLFENNEKDGLGNTTFLRQFEGKKSADPFRVGADITAPVVLSGSAQAVATGARRGLLVINEMFKKR